MGTVLMHSVVSFDGGGTGGGQFDHPGTGGGFKISSASARYVRPMRKGIDTI